MKVKCPKHRINRERENILNILMWIGEVPYLILRPNCSCSRLQDIRYLTPIIDQVKAEEAERVAFDNIVISRK